MAFYGESDIPMMLAEFGQDVTIGLQTTKGLIDIEAAHMAQSETYVQGKNVVVSIKTGSLTGLAVGATIIVDGTTYKVREHVPTDLDGALTKILCALS